MRVRIVLASCRFRLAFVVVFVVIAFNGHVDVRDLLFFRSQDVCF